MDEEIIDESFFSDDVSLEKDINVQKTGLENTFNERQVGSITIPIEPVSSHASLDVVIDMFEQQKDLSAIPIEENDRVIGVIEKETVLDATSNAFKRFVAKTCGEYVKPSPYTLNTSDYLEKISAKVNDTAINVEIKHFVVLMNNRSFYGIMSVAELNKKIEELRAHDLDKAASIQQNMLKKNSDVKGFPFDVCIWNKMANPVGGDFYLAQNITDSKFVIGCFDVSGKNVSAALLTVTIGSFFSMLKQADKSNLTAVKLVMMLDKYLQEIVPLGNFITGAICFVDYKNDIVQLFNCGHTDAYLVLKDSGKSKIATLPPTLPPFGMGTIAQELNNKVKSVYKIPLKQGLQIDLYSDGLSDMQNDDGERFGENNVKDFFMKLFDSDSYSASKFIESFCSDWTKDTLLPDDISVINIRF